MNDEYNGISEIYAGMTSPAALPSWVTSLEVGRWSTVPASNILASLDPKMDPTINPNYPNSPEWNGVGGFAAIISAWCGFEWDPIHKRLRTGLSGGHGDYAGNDEYAIDLMVESPVWVRLRKPSGAIGNILTTNDGQESSGNYADGQPRAIHSYNKPVYVPEVGLVVTMQGNTSWSASGGTGRALFYDDNGQFYKAGPPNTNGVISSGGGGCYDPSRSCLYFRGAGTERLQRYDLQTDQWSQIGTTVPVSGYSALEYIPEHDCLLWINTFFTNGFAVFDLVSQQYYYPSITGSLVGMPKLNGRCRPRQVAAGEFAVWDNGSSTTQINRLRYTGDPRTATWTVDQYLVDSGNTVTPTVKAANGTYGRFFVDRDMGIMGVINAVSQPIYFYRYK